MLQSCSKLYLINLFPQAFSGNTESIIQIMLLDTYYLVKQDLIIQFLNNVYM